MATLTTDRAQLDRAIGAFDHWQYLFEFENGASTPIFEPGHINRQEMRRRYFFDALLRVTGGALEGRRVLDLGCNAGFWSLLAVEAGAEFVLGVDGRRTHIEQAELVFGAKGVPPDSYRFEQANIFENRPSGHFDVVLCLGLMYHVSKPMELFELMAATGAELLVIDTEIHPFPGSSFQVRREPTEEPRNAVDYDTVMIPTRQAIIDLAGQFGYASVPLALNMSDYTGMPDYREGRRLTVICSRGVPLDGLMVGRRFASPLLQCVGMARASANLIRRRRAS